MTQGNTSSTVGPLSRSYLDGATGVFVPLAAVNLTGDPGAALLFGQILWWFTRAQHPTMAKRVGEQWLVKPYASWEAECGLTAHQARRALARLASLGLIETHTWKHDGTPQTHVRVLWGTLEMALDLAQVDLPDRSSPDDGSDESLDLPDRSSPPPSETGKTTDLTSSALAADANHRPEVVALCDHLADRIEDNGSPRPTVTTRWLTACRLLIDKDHRTPEQIRKAIDWCQDDEFWRCNVLSMPTLRAKYNTLRLQAQRSKPKDRGQQQADDYRELRAQMEALDELDSRALEAGQ